MQFWTPRRRVLYSAALLAGLAIGFSVFVLTSDGLTTAGGGRMGGDFPAFYAAGRLAGSSDPWRLYDAAAQQDAQRDLFPNVRDGWIPFAYPPYVARLYAPLARLPFRLAYVIHTVLMAGLCVMAVRLLHHRSDRSWLMGSAIALTFYPMAVAILGGQNTALSFFCAAATVAALRGGMTFQAGVWLGVWLFKPQLALVVTVFLVLAGHWRVLAGFAVVALALYLAEVPSRGLAWPVQWYELGVRPFIAADLQANSAAAISLRETAYRVGAASLAVPIVATTLLLAMVAVRFRRLSCEAVVGGAAAAAVLVSPHALFYDGGLALIGLLTLDPLRPPPTRPLTAAWLAAPLQLAAAAFPVSVTTVTLIGTSIGAFMRGGQLWRDTPRVASACESDPSSAPG